MPNLLDYRNSLRALLTPRERRVFARLNTPQKVQDFIDKMPPNFELDGETTMSPRRMLRAHTAHCAEAALFAAAVFAFHGQPPWLMDMRALPSDQDHVIALFQQRGLWGAISKTNHAVLCWRDPIYRSPRELAMSYAHEYCLDGGKKSLLSYSRPFNLARYKPARWVGADEDLDWLLEALDNSPHLSLAPPLALKARRRASWVELLAQDVIDWPNPRQPKLKAAKHTPRGGT